MATEHRILMSSSLLASMATVILLPVTADAALTIFTTEGDFVTDVTGAGGVLSFMEDFEDHDPFGAFGYSILSTPLDGNPNGPFTNGINPGLSISPSGGSLVGFEPGPYSGNITSSVVGTLQTNTSLILTFVGGTDAVGFDGWGIGSMIANAMKEFDYSVFGTGGELLGSGNYQTPDAENIGQFFGVASPDAIGSIMISGSAFGLATSEYVDNVQAWSIPAPGAFALFGLAGIAATRRRRS